MEIIKNVTEIAKNVTERSLKSDKVTERPPHGDPQRSLLDPCMHDIVN